MTGQFKKIALGTFCLILAGCQYFNKNSETLHQLSIEAPVPVTANVYTTSTQNNTPKYTYVGLLENDKPLNLKPGHYTIANKCSFYEIDFIEPHNIKVSQLNLRQESLYNEDLELNTYLTCENKISHKVETFTNQNSFLVFPGYTTVTIVGKNFLINAPTEQAKQFFISLYPLTLKTMSWSDDSTYFLHLNSDLKKNFKHPTPLISQTLNKTVWLPEAEYELEVNGTKTIANVTAESQSEIILGGLEVLAPKNFYHAESLNFIHSPIFAYLNKTTLLKLNQKYSLFPNEYKIDIGNSKVIQKIEIKPGEIERVQTYGAQINPPKCIETEQNKCIFTQKVLIHAKNKSEILLKFPLGEPFLVFAGEYEYSIEGTEGIVKRLRKSPSSVLSEQIGELKFHWKINISDKKFETQKIEIEPVCCGLEGKSKDINSFKPKRLLLPVGQYRLVSSIRQEMGVLIKRTNFTNITSGFTSKIEIPIYAQTDQNLNMYMQNNDNLNEGPSQLMPITQ